MKQSLDWFKHDATASESPKFIALRASPYGWAGEGRFWALNGLIARSDGCQLDLGRKFAKAGVADKLDMTPAELEAYLVFLRDECELIEYEDSIVTTKRTRDDLEPVVARRRKEREKYLSRYAHHSDEGNALSDAGNGVSDAGTDTDIDIEKEKEKDTEEAGFFEFAKRKAEERGAGNVDAYARALMASPAFRAEWEASKPHPPRNDALPEPPTCTCGGEIKADRWGGDGRCLGCGSWWRYDRASGAWAMDNEEF